MFPTPILFQSFPYPSLEALNGYSAGIIPPVTSESGHVSSSPFYPTPYGATGYPSSLPFNHHAYAQYSQSATGQSTGKI